MTLLLDATDSRQASESKELSDLPPLGHDDLCKSAQKLGQREGTSMTPSPPSASASGNIESGDVPEPMLTVKSAPGAGDGEWSAAHSAVA